MVREQLRARDITDERVLKILQRVPRHLFVPPSEAHRAYEDHPLSIGQGQTISQPYMVALMTQCLALGGWESVLEIGTGSGYQTAILSELAQAVFTVERFTELSEQSRKVLTALGYANVNFRVGDGSQGWPEHAPYDRIVVTAGAPQVPEALRMELADGGILVIPVGPEEGQNLLVIRRNHQEFEKKTVCACVFVKLVGQQGWPDDQAGSERGGHSGRP